MFKDFNDRFFAIKNNHVKQSYLRFEINTKPTEQKVLIRPKWPKRKTKKHILQQNYLGKNVCRNGRIFFVPTSLFITVINHIIKKN